MKTRAVLFPILLSIGWILLHEGHGPAEESGGIEVMSIVWGAIGVILVGGIVWFGYSRYLA